MRFGDCQIFLTMHSYHVGWSFDSGRLGIDEGLDVAQCIYCNIVRANCICSASLVNRGYGVTASKADWRARGSGEASHLELAREFDGQVFVTRKNVLTGYRLPGYRLRKPQVTRSFLRARRLEVRTCLSTKDAKAHLNTMWRKRSRK